MTETEIAEACAKIIANWFGGTTTSTGGKGTTSRKKKSGSRSTAAISDARIGVALKNLGAINIHSIEKINFFRMNDDSDSEKNRVMSQIIEVADFKYLTVGYLRKYYAIDIYELRLRGDNVRT